MQSVPNLSFKDHSDKAKMKIIEQVIHWALVVPFPNS